MTTKVKQYVKEQNMIEQGDSIVVGISGGADSVALLLVLKELQKQYGLRLYGVHVHHGIREEADEDVAYARTLCDSLKVPFFLYRADVPAMAEEMGLTEEEMGRVYRYRCFCKVYQEVGANKVAVAHHMDDQAETVLFRLVRGSNLVGMEGMQSISSMKLDGRDITVIRPLLTIRKQEIIAWLQSNNVNWKEDRTNQDNTYARNAIRNQVVPVLQQINSKAVEHMAEYALEMETVQSYIQCQVQAYVKEHVAVEEAVCKVNREHLRMQHPVLVKGILYEMLCQMCGARKDIGSVHVQALFDLLRNQTGRSLSLPYGVKAQIQYEMLEIRKSLQGESLCADERALDFCWSVEDMSRWNQGQYEVRLPEGGVLSLQFCQKNQCDENQWKDMIFMVENSKNNYTKYFECDTIKGTLHLRRADKNDYFVMNNSGEEKRLSRYFIDAKVPADARTKVPVIALNQEVLWIVPMRRCEAYKVTKDSQTVLVVEYKGE